MNVSCKHLLPVSILLVLLVNLSSAASPRKICVFKCLKAVIKCKREVNVMIRKNVDCCDEYRGCYKMCDPNKIPSCTNERKRGSWNKRAMLPPREIEESPFPVFPRDLLVDDNDLDTDWELADSFFP